LNILQFFPDTSDPTTLPNCTTAADETCPYAVRPDEVIGMFTKDINCFVATAAYGSSMEPKLGVFRDFRKELLLRGWGRQAVKGYYQIGPYAARFIADKPVLRTMARGALWPAYGLSWLAVRYGLNQALWIAFIMILLTGAALWVAARRIRTR